MLIRATLIYCLAVSTLLFAAVALWQRIELGASLHTLADLTARAESLQRDLDSARTEAASAKRLAEAAEDSFNRLAAREAEKPGLAQLSEQLAAAARDRDVARAEAAALLRDAEAATQKTGRMKEELTALRAELADARRANEDAVAARLTAERDLLAVRSALGKDAAQSQQSVSTGAVPAADPPASQPVSPSQPAAVEPAAVEPAASAAEAAKGGNPTERQAAVEQEGTLEPTAGAAAAGAAGAGKSSAVVAPKKLAPAQVKKSAGKRREKPKASASGSFFPF